MFYLHSTALFKSYLRAQFIYLINNSFGLHWHTKMAIHLGPLNVQSDFLYHNLIPLNL